MRGYLASIRLVGRPCINWEFSDIINKIQMNLIQESMAFKETNINISFNSQDHRILATQDTVTGDDRPILRTN